MRFRLAKLLFPRMPEDERRRQMRLILASFLVALAVSGIVVLIMLLTDQMTEYWIARL